MHKEKSVQYSCMDFSFNLEVVISYRRYCNLKAIAEAAKEIIEFLEKTCKNKQKF